MEKVVDNGLIEWGVAAQPLAGQTESGDQYLVELFSNGALLAVVDGLGHGDKAAVAARLAVVTLKEAAAGPVQTLIQRSHERLRQSRGVVMSLASVNTFDHTITWLGVGNVEGVLLRADPAAKPATEGLVPWGGVVGYHLPALRPVTLPVRTGDTLIFVTDGIRSGFIKEQRQALSSSAGQPQTASPQQLADHILAHYGRTTDDALVLVARYWGGRRPGHHPIVR
jgi:hypothetical protein